MARKVGGGGVDLWGVAIVNQQNGWRRRAAAKSPGVGQPLGGTNFGSAAAEEKKGFLLRGPSFRICGRSVIGPRRRQPASSIDEQPAQQQHVITCGSSSEQGPSPAGDIVPPHPRSCQRPDPKPGLSVRRRTHFVCNGITAPSHNRTTNSPGSWELGAGRNGARTCCAGTLALCRGGSPAARALRYVRRHTGEPRRGLGKRAIAILAHSRRRTAGR